MGEIRIKRDVADAIVYGFHVDPSIQDPSNAVTYLEDAVGMTPASMGSTSFNSGSWADAFFIPSPCMVRYDGTVDYYLDPSDYSKKADGTASDIADSNYAGNAMMEWGLIWFKFEPGEADGEGYFYVSNKKVNDSFNCWCNYDANNNITQHFYTAIYNGTGTDKLRSLSGVQLTSGNGSGNTTGQQEITRAMANNTSDMTEWYIDLWADEVLATGLLYLVGKSLNLQATFGRGLDSGGYTAKNAYVTGTLNDKGLFWGDITGGNNAVKVFGMENRWGCCWHRTAGLFGTSTGYAYKLTHGTVDGSTATEFETASTGYIPVPATQPGTGHVTKMSFGKYGILPTATGGSTSTYYCDYFIKGSGFAMVGGNPNYGLYCGLYIALHQSADVSDWSISTSLSLKPRAKVPYNPDWDNLPAHQFVNGQWVDIPTHHYTNGRWQGELTSQSPLKFRADGEMLDWRVEGASGGVGDWDDEAQKYRIPVRVEGENLYSSTWKQGFWAYDTGSGWGTDSKYVRTAKMPCEGNTKYEFVCSLPDGAKDYGFVFWDANGNYIGNIQSSDVQNTPVKYSATSPANAKMMAINIARYSDGERHPSDILSFDLYELHETNIYADHQLLDGDSIDYTTDQTAIPIATGNNTLTVDTAVQPSKVFVKFEG